MKLGPGCGTGILTMNFFYLDTWEEKYSSFVEYMNLFHQLIKFNIEISKDLLLYVSCPRASKIMRFQISLS